MEIFEKNYIETLSADFFNADAIRPQPYKIYRVNAKGRRFYFTWEDRSKDPEIYFSVTTFIKQTSEESMYLSRWRGTHGNIYCDEFMNEAAKYGTLMHIEIGRFVRQGYYDYSTLYQTVSEYMERHRIDPDRPCILDDEPSRGSSKWTNRKLYVNRLKRDLLCFQQFCLEHNFKPIAMELVLKGSDGYATAIDLVGFMEVEIKGFHGEVHKSANKLGLPKETIMKKRVLAIVDFKSGKHFYENHAKQLEACKRLWNENYPDMPVERLYNWSPSDYRGETPKYKIKDQTGTVDEREFEAYVALGKVKKENQLSEIKVTEFRNQRIYMGKSHPELVQTYDLVSWIKKWHGPESGRTGNEAEVSVADRPIDSESSRPVMSREESFQTSIPEEESVTYNVTEALPDIEGDVDDLPF